jgi:pimeloyl-ACP methyl ester carboxylesterase
LRDQPTDTPGRVLCLRGLADVFSLGMNELARRLREDGIQAVAASGSRWRSLADDIAEKTRQRQPLRPLVLVGHSYGADNAVRLATRLQQTRTPVDLLVLLDATNPDPVPSNVRQCVHFYQPTTIGALFPGVFAGHPVMAAEGNDRTRISNRPLNRQHLGDAASGVNHFNVDTSETVQRLVLDEILPLFAGSPQAEYDSAFGANPFVDERPPCVTSRP